MDASRALDAIKTLLKPVEAGAAASVFLLGLTTIQVYLYHSRFPTDRWTIKLLVSKHPSTSIRRELSALSVDLKVATVYLLQVAQVLATLQYIYTVSIDWYGRPEKYMVRAPPGLYMNVLLGSAISTLVQFFLALRAGRFAGSVVITAVFWLLIMVSFGFAVAVFVVLCAFTLKEFVRDWSWLVAAGKIVSTISDVFIAAILCFSLFRERKQVLKRTTRVVDRLIVISLQTGLLTSLLSLAVMFSNSSSLLTKLYAVVWVGLFMCLGGLHSNSLLVALNARSELRQLGQASAFTMNASRPSHPTVSLAFAHDSNVRDGLADAD
ncbi:hypothetical protein ONZ45_g5416 [Pleurotus djamor]|nr:hypothetical protein ONZ45_g5416 [Pleurotus djamor]